MQFSDTTNRTGLIQDCEDVLSLGAAGISGNSTLLGTFTRWINEGYSIAANIIMRADGRMQWDDTNHTNLPTATFDLVNGQKDYTILSATPTALQDWLEMERLEINDGNNNWILLKKIDEKDIPIAETEFQDVDSIPRWFDFKGNSIFLYPAPNYNSTGGGLIYFNRAPSYFSASDTTKRPGFATHFHQFLSMYASYKFGLVKGLAITNSLRNELGSFEAGRETGMSKNLADFYRGRNKFEIPVIKRQYQKYR